MNLFPLILLIYNFPSFSRLCYILSMIYVFAWLMFGILSAVVASNKGRSAGGWFLLGLLIGPFGFLLSLVVSKVEPKTSRNSLNISADTAPEKETEELTRKCPYCAESIKMEAIICRYCKKDLPPVDLDREKTIADSKLFMKQLSTEEKTRIEKYLTMTEAERRKDCFACKGESVNCGMCEAMEAKLKSYLEAKKVLTE